MILCGSLCWCDTETVKVLLDAGVDVNAKNRRGHTALAVAHESSWPGETAVMKTLVEAGAELIQIARADSKRTIWPTSSVLENMLKEHGLET
jgi:ankyrin repeat protein